MNFDRPYKGIRVVDLSQGVAGPYCGMLLAQLGADVIKIEPKEGDWARILGKTHGDHTSFSVAANLGKRSIVMDLKAKGASEIVDKLIGEADVFVEGFRPGVTERLGFGYERMSKLNKKLIYVSVSGFGQSGPMRERPAMDPMLQAFTGFMAENKGHDGIPHRTPVILFDMTTALYAQQAVATTLFAQRVHGMETGRHIQMSLMESAAAVQVIRVMDGFREGPFRIAASPSGTFRTADGWLQLIVVRDREMERFAKAVGHPEWVNDPRFATSAARRENVEEITRLVSEVIITRNTDHWQQVLSDAQLQNERVQDYRAFVESEQARAIELFSWLMQPGSDEPWPMPNVPGYPKFAPGTPYAHSPTTGEHTREIMAEIGYGDDDIARLSSAGVIGAV